MKLIIRIVAVLFGIYILIVVAFESLLGYYQPQGGNTIVITTYDGSEGSERVVTELASNGQRYIAVNHWPRAWYYRLLDNPRITVAKEDEVTEHVAVAVEGVEQDPAHVVGREVHRPDHPVEAAAAQPAARARAGLRRFWDRRGTRTSRSSRSCRRGI